ncbi:anaphase-promoting complex subunit 4 isoform X3 [Eucalyptus grandis]|uniref:anaphase-promoting complex subunit 4 isoform X3 n=1 Tax=Eucalyptus grandis TaxID=71139 RepID=UPI00192ED1F7|nr:anaphase-promoting complex subunit 4 isoform X3 [Eucalyptus grandis]
MKSQIQNERLLWVDLYCWGQSLLVLTLSLRSFPIYQFRVNSLDEVGMKCVSQVVCGAGKELLLVVLNHLRDDFEFASDYISFQIHEESFLDVTNCIAVVSGLMNDSSNVKKGRSLEGSCCASLLVTVVWIRLYLR